MFGRAVRICVCARLHLSRTTDPVNLWFVSCVLWVVEVVGGWVDGWAGGSLRAHAQEAVARTQLAVQNVSEKVHLLETARGLSSAYLPRHWASSQLRRTQPLR